MKRITQIATYEGYNGVTRDVFITVEYSDSKLSITGVEGPRLNGNCWGGCGQIIGSDWVGYKPCNGIDLDRLRSIWDRWHLNHMNAGTIAQEEFLRDNRVVAVYPESQYTADCELLSANNLNPDGDYIYGTLWLKEDVPQDVIDWLDKLPDNSASYPWRS